MHVCIWMYICMKVCLYVYMHVEFFSTGEMNILRESDQIDLPIGLCSRYTQVSLGRLRRGSNAAKESNALPEHKQGTKHPTTNSHKHIQRINTMCLYH